ncbi:CRISPR-associated helicase/endonuclease Cas3 [Syntrophobacter fumaroxidans]|uniref:CRISPR-associated helicase, Cas3 family n=1 Tax=Syntrophobacter fumaroxidans (strain DSM 10017 / MPOB) TaxID=335543 RepID=A0LM50_SYNFM|nr:CRISPR-associated helicase/endonuclease Cas3 [Syntrophobacter fumaroxidans]ABK18502.1 CRISPR-associated helicase, Cas3 family [Syntrophobacter fumaroxidans MPOB]
MTEEDVFRFWGKTSGNVVHPAVCHMLDTGIVACELLMVQPHGFISKLADEFGITTDALPQLAAFLAALHDIGKISPGFQAKRPDLSAPLKLEGYVFSRADEDRHTLSTLETLPDLLIDCLQCEDSLAIALSRALAAHHGVFTGQEAQKVGAGKWIKARRAALEFLSRLFWDKSLTGLGFPSTPALVILAGLVSVSDWLSSAEENFPYLTCPRPDLREYVADRTQKARELVSRLRFDVSSPAATEFHQLFDFTSPNPSQTVTLQTVNELHHPMLVVIESPMGSGKTEAAQAVYAHLSCEAGLRGMYYALPTQATGNAMLPRTARFLTRLGLETGTELHLLHTNADLNQDYERLRISSLNAEPGDVSASSWFTARKRGLLAAHGVGTLDQALLAALKVRHFFVRLFGLAGKLLVLDEVHAYDAYMVEEIYRLIGWLAHCHTSVVLLSATLPKARRKKLIQAFRPEVEVPDDIRYPCVTGVDISGAFAAHPIEGLKPDTIYVEPVIAESTDKPARILSLLLEKLADGGCAACIMNTVGEAQDLHELLRHHFPADEVLLFHSRFTLERKLRIEHDILSRYASDGKRPHRGIVIATQVIEQSLDVDFDLMITDLAPIDLLLQRAGRLHRHERARPQLLRPRNLWVLMPEFRSRLPDFGGSEYVYTPDILLKTALLFSAEEDLSHLEVSIPTGVSALIECVYGDDFPPEVPEHLLGPMRGWEAKRLGDETSQTFFAACSALIEAKACLRDPDYLGQISMDNDDDCAIVTRLTRPNVMLVVVENGRCLTVADKAEERKLFSSTVATDNTAIVKHFLAKEPPGEWADSPLLRHCRPLFVSGGKSVERPDLSYDDEFGLRFAR